MHLSIYTSVCLLSNSLANVCCGSLSQYPSKSYTWYLSWYSTNIKLTIHPLTSFSSFSMHACADELSQAKEFLSNRWKLESSMTSIWGFEWPPVQFTKTMDIFNNGDDARYEMRKMNLSGRFCTKGTARNPSGQSTGLQVWTELGQLQLANIVFTKSSHVLCTSHWFKTQLGQLKLAKIVLAHS